MFNTSDTQTDKHVQWPMDIPASQHAMYNTTGLHYTGYTYSHQNVQQQMPSQTSSIESTHEENIISGWSSLTPPSIASRIGAHVTEFVPIDPAECRWSGSPCGMALQDLSPGGITRHLKEHHFDDVVNPWHDRKRGGCEWSAVGQPCCIELYYGGFGKHVASVHLKSISCKCPACGRECCRVDALRRHQREACVGRAPTDPWTG